MKKILTAPNSYKGYLYSVDAARIMSQAIKDFNCEYEAMQAPLSDGGDGFLSALEFFFQAKKFSIETFDSYLNEIKASSIFIDNLKAIFIESAEIIGLKLLNPSALEPLKSTSYGLGRALRKILETNCDNIIIGLGGTATIDAGAGFLCGLGAKFIDASGKNIIPTAGTLKNIKHIDLSGIEKDIYTKNITVCCDVFAPIFGDNGAIRLYGPQKGLRKEQFQIIEQGFDNYIRFIENYIEDDDILRNFGAAGGIPISLKIFPNVKILSGSDFFLKIIKFDELAKNCDVLVTGEGKLDAQTFQGKLPYKVALEMKKLERTTAIIVADSEFKNSIYPFDIIFEMKKIENFEIKNPVKMLYLATKILLENNFL